VKPLYVIINILDTSYSNTVLVYIFVKQIKFKFLLKMSKTGCVCVVECISYAHCWKDMGVCFKRFGFRLVLQKARS